MKGDVERILGALNQGDVRYLVVGGVAVLLHGFRALQVPLDRTEATVISAEDLIALKRQAGRPQDLADIDALIELERGQR